MKVRVTIEADIELDDGETPDECAAALRANPMHIAETLIPGAYTVTLAPPPLLVTSAAEGNSRTASLALRAANILRGPDV